MPWMVVKTEPRREDLAQRSFQLLRRESYYPRFRDWKSGKIKALYPNYIFVEHDDCWSFVRKAMGVLSPIFIDGAPGTVCDDHIDDLRSQEDSDGLILIDVSLGQPMTVVAGEHVGWSGTYRGMTDMDRCQVLFNIIGQEIVRDIPTKHIRAEPRILS